MGLFAISDLHLSFGTNKPMDVFGWQNYEQRLLEQWNSLVAPEDWVLLPGDLSWATYLEETEADFRFIDRLNGTKILGKGNHDYWWTTAKKMREYAENMGFTSLRFLYNNSYLWGTTGICGTRGWCNHGNVAEDTHLWERELQRLQLSLESAKGCETVVCCLHYPPVDLSGKLSEAHMELFSRYNVRCVVYGHLHGRRFDGRLPEWIEGIRFQLVSCDYLNFAPIRLE